MRVVMESQEEPMRSLWLDVSTLWNWRGPPTGIARTLQQVLHHWQSEEHMPVRLCRYDPIHELYHEVERDQVMRPNVAGTKGTAEPTVSPSSVWQGRRAGLSAGDLSDACYHLGQAARCAGRMGRDLVRRGVRRGQRILARLRRPGERVAFAPGDVLFLAGTGWHDSPSSEVLYKLRHDNGVSLTQLIYDIIPLRCPHLCTPSLTKAVGTWLPGVLAQADLVVTISEHSRRDLIEYGREQGIAVPAVEKIRLGDEPGADEGEITPMELVSRAPGPFVLYVSTIGVNKNQSLLFQVWRRLIDRHGGGVPTLVLVGQPGWRAETLLRELRLDAALSRHVVHLHKANDRQLRWLYRRCLFTLFPSHYEGWGLGVAEGLVHGKYGIVSNAASLPEVGGNLVDYHDPLDGHGCLNLVEKALLEPGWLASREERIRREYRRTSWRECARRLLEIVDRRFELVPPMPQRRAA